MRAICFLLVFAASISWGKTIQKIKTAHCKGGTHSYLILDRETKFMEAQLGDLPLMTNWNGHQRLNIDVRPKIFNTTYTGVGSLVLNMMTGYWGSIFLLADENRILTPQSSLLALFTDTAGNAQDEFLQCDLTYY